MADGKEPAQRNGRLDGQGPSPDSGDPRGQLELLRMAVRQAPLILIVYDRDFIFRLIAGGALASRDLKENQLVGVNALELLKDAPDLLENLMKMKAGQATRWSGERGGMHLDSYGTPLYDAEGNFDGAVSMVIDVTERVKAEEEIRRLNADLENRIRERTRELEEAIRELEAFSYSVSHDLRAPLRHIGGFVEMLTAKSGASLDDQGRRYLAIISESAKRMDTLISHLLSFSRLGRQDMLRLRFSMKDVAAQTVSALAPDTEGREIEWTLGDIPDAVGDPSLVRQVLANLVSNAIKFTKGRKPARIEIGACDSGNGSPAYFVRDNGAGFDMKYCDKLFGVFQRLHGENEFEGTGIGLANVRRIVARHGGRVWAEGAMGAGATFFFTLPAPEKAE
ncbi:MAG TPA: ATP-binding protein [Fibrobacteria bacterium]|nr:ATP-binding protein [Fibrobacteria bacterium]